FKVLASGEMGSSLSAASASRSASSWRPTSDNRWRYPMCAKGSFRFISSARRNCFSAPSQSHSYHSAIHARIVWASTQQQAPKRVHAEIAELVDLWLRLAHDAFSEHSEVFTPLLKTFLRRSDQHADTRRKFRRFGPQPKHEEMEMHSNTRHSVARLALLSLLASNLAFATSRAAAAGEANDQSRSQAKRLEGTWVTQVTIRDCHTGAPVREFPALNTFAKGGTLIDTTSAVGPALRTPGHGVWEKTGAHRFRAFTLAFLFSPANVWIGTQTVT